MPKTQFWNFQTNFAQSGHSVARRLSEKKQTNKHSTSLLEAWLGRYPCLISIQWKISFLRVSYLMKDKANPYLVDEKVVKDAYNKAVWERDNQEEMMREDGYF